MKEAIEGLRRLDQIDRRLQGLEREKAALPEERTRAEESVRVVREELRAVEGEIQKAALARKTAEGEIEKNFEAIGKHEVQKNFVKTTREYEALNAEIAALRERSTALSEAAFAEMERGEELEGRRGALRKELGEREEALGKAKAALDERARELDGAIASARADRGAAAAAVPAVLLGRYEKIRAGKEGVAVARVERDACEVCYRSIPPQRIIEIKKLEKLVTCEGCGRILLCE